MYQIEHEVIESVYFRDPNGYYLEISRPVRPFSEADIQDAELTLAVAIAEEERLLAAGNKLQTIEPVRRAKGEHVAELIAEEM